MTEERVVPTLPEGRRAVLYALRRRGQATADDIARQLDMTVSGARQHLTALVDDGFAEATELPRPPGQRGRAQLAYTVTDRADALFPKAYGELTNELLGYASESDSGLVDTLFCRRRDERIRNANERLGRKRGLKAKVAELTRILDDDGYLATFEDVAPGSVPHRRAQLRDLGRRAAVRPGLHERARLHPVGVAGCDRRARTAHGGRCAALRVRSPRPRERSLINTSGAVALPRA